jgi:hypothetical protein
VASCVNNVLGENAGDDAKKVEATGFSEGANKVCSYHLEGTSRNVVRPERRLMFGAVDLCTLALIASHDIPCYIFVKSRPPIVPLNVLLYAHEFRMASSRSIVSCVQDIFAQLGNLRDINLVLVEDDAVVALRVLGLLGR